MRKDKDFFWYDDPFQKFSGTEDEYADREGQSAMQSFAVVQDGQWYERGKMGWWGMVSDEKSKEEWNKEFTALLDGLPDDALLSVYDCHI